MGSALTQGADGVVITHGTDTMEETALWLELTYDGDPAVVLTGAQRSADAPDADGPGNLRDALAVAASADARGLGVLVVFAGTVWQPLGLQKVATGDLRGFEGTAVGTVSDGRFTPSGAKVRPHLGALAAASRPASTSSPCIPALTPSRWTPAWRRERAGSCSSRLARATHRPRWSTAWPGCRDGVTVAVSTRVPGGRVGPGYEPGRDLWSRRGGGAAAAARADAGAADGGAFGAFTR